MKAYLCDRCEKRITDTDADLYTMPHAGWFMQQATGRRQEEYHLCRGCYDQYESLVLKWWKEADDDTNTTGD